MMQIRVSNVTLLFSLSLAMFLFAVACGGPGQQQRSSGVDTLSRPGQDTTDSSAAAGNDTVSKSEFQAADSVLVITGKLKGVGAQFTADVPVQRRSKIVAVLVPADPSANIRFSQIIYPDGTSDGPFGREITLPAEERGVYRLIVGHNLMAEGPATAEFTVRVSLLSR